MVAPLLGLGSYTKNPCELDLDLKNHESPPAKPSIIEPPQIEFKSLPSRPYSIFLGKNNTLPIIVINDLLPWQLSN